MGFKSLWTGVSTGQDSRGTASTQRNDTGVMDGGPLSHSRRATTAATISRPTRRTTTVATSGTAIRTYALIGWGLASETRSVNPRTIFVAIADLPSRRLTPRILRSLSLGHRCHIDTSGVVALAPRFDAF